MLRFIKRLAAEVPTPATNRVTLFIDDVGIAKLKDEAGTVTDVGAAGTTGVLKDFASATRTAGNVAFSTTSYVDFDTATDLVLTCAAGDIIEVNAAGLWSNDGAQGHLAVFSVVAGSPVNGMHPAAATSAGHIAWTALPLSTYRPIAGGFLYTAVAGDISGGTITLRLRGKCETAAVRTLFAGTTACLHWWAKNIGPAL